MNNSKQEEIIIHFKLKPLKSGFFCNPFKVKYVYGNMKRILLTLIALSISLTSLSQYIDISSFVRTQYNKTPVRVENYKDIIPVLLRDNPTVGTYYDFNHKFNDGKEQALFIFIDKDGYFMDVVFFDKNPRYGVYSDHGGRVKLRSGKRKVVDFNMTGNFYKISMGDGTYITIEIDFDIDNDHYYYMVKDHLTEDKYLFAGNLDYFYEK